MIWLLTQVWPWLVLSAALGALTTTVLMTRVVTVERWEELPATAQDRPVAEVAATGTALGLPGDAEAAAEAVEAAAPAARPVSPFPTLPGLAPTDSPWEADELWSRPARLAEPVDRRRNGDEWSQAAAQWRSWAEEARHRPSEPAGPVSDVDLFAADREAERLGLEAGVFPASLGSLTAPVGHAGRFESPVPAGPGEREAADEADDFPYARPLEAPTQADHEPPRRFHDDRRSA